MTKIDLSNTTILLTGASDGIGKGLASYLLEMGAKVAVHYNSNKVSAESFVAEYSDRAKAFQADLSQEKEVFTLFERVEAHFEKIDTIILNAGVFLPHSSQSDTKDWLAVWKKTISINLDAVGLLTKLGLDHFLKMGEGRFVFMGSRATFRGETEEYLALCSLQRRIDLFGTQCCPFFWEAKHQVLCCFSRIYKNPNGRTVHTNLWRRTGIE